MGKMRIFIILTVAALMALPMPTLACTSFAVYSENTLYGMNFDYPETEIRFRFIKHKGLNGFYVEFKERGNYYTFSGVNDKGLFMAMQIQSPSLPLKDMLEKNEMYIGELIGAIDKYGIVDEVKNSFEGKRLAPMRFPTHIMAADSTGDSVIIEAGEEKNELVTTSDRFMVMTNFRNADFAGLTYDKVAGLGSDRYKTAYTMITERFSSFDAGDGWEVLKKTVQTSGYPTLCSTVYDPGAGQVYLALGRDFSRVWKISLDDGTISTHMGFETDYAIRIDEQGITASELVSYKPDANNNAWAPAAETPGKPQAKGDGNTLMFSLFLITLVLIGLSIMPILMISRAALLKSKNDDEKNKGRGGPSE